MIEPTPYLTDPSQPQSIFFLFINLMSFFKRGFDIVVSPNVVWYGSMMGCFSGMIGGLDVKRFSCCLYVYTSVVCGNCNVGEWISL